MQKPPDPDDYELRDEYDLSKMTVVPKGRYAPHRREGKNMVLLAEDLVEAFPSDEAVNEALRLVMQISELPAKYSTVASSLCGSRPIFTAAWRWKLLNLAQV